MSVVLALQTKNIIGDDVAYFDILFPYIFLNYVDFSFSSSGHRRKISHTSHYRKHLKDLEL